MAVQFILGRSGTGKTTYCIRSIVDELRKPGVQQLILLVPEQATYQAERAVITEEKITGYNRLNVLSFDRLQFLLSGKNTARPALSRIGRQMAVHRILLDNKGKLQIFDTSVSRPGLARQMTATIEELNQYARTPEDIKKLIGGLAKDKCNNLTMMKFSDIGLILQEYLNFMETDYLDPDIQLIHACRKVESSTLVKGARLWVDGFAGFTGAELEVLTELLKATSDAQIALCLDPSRIDLADPAAKQIDPVDLFYPTQRTYTELIARIKKYKLNMIEPIVFEQALRFKTSEKLAHIERNIFNHESDKLDSAENLRIISAPNERAEVGFVAGQILELVKEKNYRYRDIALIASDIDSYQHYIRAYFEDFQIPYFIDRRKPLNHHPVVQLVCSALQAVTGGFSYSDIFAFLKTDLVPLQRDEIDVLENYCLAFGITSDDWQTDKQWSFADKEKDSFDQQRIDLIRLKAVEPLLKLRDALCPIGDSSKLLTAPDFTKAVFDFLEQLKVKQTIGGWIEQTDGDETDVASDEHQQFYNRLVDIFDELNEVFTGRSMTAADFFVIINSAFSQLTLAFIPPKLDQVLVGSIERSRHPDLKAVFLIGATQRQFPVPLAAHGLLTDDDRDIAESADFQLVPASAQTLTERQYLAYIAFTRPSEFLCITYPSVDEKGAAIPPSQFIDNLESLFENLQEESIAGRQINIEKIHSKTELAQLLCTCLGRDIDSSQTCDNESLGRLLENICSDDRFAELGADVLSAVNYDNCAQLDSDVVSELFARQINSSATRLGTFAACPYRYFARYTLNLLQRKEFKFEPLDLGSFYHSVLDALLKTINLQKKNFMTIEDEELLKILKNQIEHVIQSNSFISNFRRRSPHNAYIISSASEILEDCVLAVARMVKAGSFSPGFSEVSFGQAEGAVQTIGQYEMTLPDNRVLSLNGKIDRLDIADIDGEKIAVVFDYKRRDMSFSWSKFYHGLDIQLPLYMLAVRKSSRLEIQNAAGAFYIPVEIGTEKTTLHEIMKKADTFAYKAKGIFNGKYFERLDGSVGSGWSKFYNFSVTSKDVQYGNYGKSGALRPDDFEKVLNFTAKKIIELAEQITSGRTDVRPYRLCDKSPCSYCEYLSVCRFDWQINEYNPLISLSKNQVLEMVEDVNA